MEKREECISCGTTDPKDFERDDDDECAACVEEMEKAEQEMDEESED